MTRCQLCGRAAPRTATTWLLFGILCLIAGGIVLRVAQIVTRELAGPAPVAADPRAAVIEDVKAYELRTGLKPVHIREGWIFCLPFPEQVARR